MVKKTHKQRDKLLGVNKNSSPLIIQVSFRVPQLGTYTLFKTEHCFKLLFFIFGGQLYIMNLYVFKQCIIIYMSKEIFVYGE